MQRFTILHEAMLPPGESGWRLCLHWGIYVSTGEDQSSYYGYRFIWRRPNGTLQPARGQARIPSLDDARRLMKMAEDQGWGGEDAFSEEHQDGRRVVIA